MKKNNMTYGLNLDNLRCLLYGAGTNDVLVNTPLFETPIYSENSGQQPAIVNRKEFFDAFFPECVRNILNLYLSPLSDKEQGEFLSEISTRHASKRGTSSFFKKIQALYDTDKNAWTETLSQSKGFFDSMDSRKAGRQMLSYIAAILPVEEGKHNDYVCHILGILKEKLGHAITLSAPLDSITRLFSLLLVAALLKEKFPIKLINSTQPVEIRNVYWAKALVSAVLANLNVLLQQLRAQDSFLDECGRLTANDSMQVIKRFYKIEIQRMDEALQIADITSLDRLITSENMSRVREHALFLHHIYAHVDVFIRKSMEQINRYLDIGIFHEEELRNLLDRYRECTLFLRLMVYWHIVGLYSLLPSEITEDLYIFAANIAPSLADKFPVLVKMEPEDVKRQCTLYGDKFRWSMGRVQNKSIKMVFPDSFYQADFCQNVVDTELKAKANIMILTVQSDESYEKCIVDNFFALYQQMDKICCAGYQFVSSFYVQYKNKTSPRTKEKDMCAKAVQFLEDASHSPVILISKPLCDMLCQKNVDFIELQQFFAEIKITSHSFLQYIERIQNAQSEIDKITGLDDFLTCVDFQVKYWVRTANYWFADWDDGSMTYIQKKLDSLSFLKAPTSEWKRTRKEAEQWIQHLLDEKENELHLLENEIASETWEIFELRAKLKEQLLNNEKPIESPQALRIPIKMR